MKLTYYGTAAAEGWPALFCECDACQRARMAGGRNMRTRSQSMIDDKILIDFPADTYHHMLTHGLPLPSIRHCLITHNHADHLYPADFAMRGPNFTHRKQEFPLTVYGSAPTGTSLNSLLENKKFMSTNRIKFTKLEPFLEYSIEHYKIIPLQANHDPNTSPLIYLISDGASTLLYANDTGIHMKETWEYLEAKRPRINMISLDCTEGTNVCSNYHMGLSANIEFANRLEKLGCISGSTLRYLNHFSHNGKAIYDEMVPLAAKQGFSVSYDGLEVEF